MERSRRHPSKAATVIRAALVSEETGSAFHTSFFFSCFFFILRRMGKNKALAHHTFTYFQTRRVSIYLSCFRSPTLAGAPFGSHCRYSVSCPLSVVFVTTPAAQAAVVYGCVCMSTRPDVFRSSINVNEPMIVPA